MQILIILSLIFLNLPYLSFAQDKKIELFVSGQGFDSVQDYKLERLRNIVKKVYDTKEKKETEGVVAEIVNEFSYNSIMAMADNDLTQLVVRKFKEGQKSLARDVKADSAELNDIKAMTEDLLKDKRLKNTFYFEPEKVKTLEISPSTPAQASQP